MKNLAAVLTFVFMTGITSLCSASISVDDCVLGGISLYSDDAYVKSVYGEPTKIERSRLLDAPVYYYGDSFFISFNSDEKTSVYAMYTTANNGIATSKGIAVGSRRSDVLNAYGTPTRTAFDERSRVTGYFFDAGAYDVGIAVFFDPAADQVKSIAVGMFDG